MRPYPAASSGTATFTAVVTPATAASTPADALQTKRWWNMSQQGRQDSAASINVPIVAAAGGDI